MSIIIIIIIIIIIVLIAPFALIQNDSFIMSLVVNITMISSPGDMTQSLTSLPSHFNPQLLFTFQSMPMLMVSLILQ